ncbi:mavicyanin [Euphorbia lathyris]|uniref:mavicyanin n=1 Tax=Euphorbia lathyris TaxID=212925 RepID=UPI0033133BDA
MEQKILLVLMCVALMGKETMATQHLVGGSQGWDESTDFDSWTSATKFKVGDQLVFKYSSGLHSVVELSDEDAYKKCDIGTALNSMRTGNDVVKLNKPGTRYFGCGTLGHCQQGMKVKVTTGTGTGTPDSSSSPAAASSSCSIKSHIYLVLVYGLLAISSFVYML